MGVVVGLGVAVHTAGVAVGGGVDVSAMMVASCEKRLQANTPTTMINVTSKRKNIFLFMGPPKSISSLFGSGRYEFVPVQIAMGLVNGIYSPIENIIEKKGVLFLVPFLYRVSRYS
jgi:hypothetical protein